MFNVTKLSNALLNHMNYLQVKNQNGSTLFQCSQMSERKLIFKSIL